MEIKELTYLLSKIMPEEEYSKLNNVAEDVLKDFGEECDKFMFLPYELQDKIIQCLIAIRHA